MPDHVTPKNIHDNENQTYKVTPLVMVVEDKSEDLANRLEHFRDLGCTALGFVHSDDALDALFVVPAVDLILTDIDLDGTGEDESGIALARFVRDTKMNVPVFGYSAYITEDDMKSEDRDLFSGALLPKAMPAERINKAFEDLRDFAVRCRIERRGAVEKRVALLREKYNIKIKEVALVRELILNTDGASGFDEALYEACYSMSIVHPRENGLLSNPILIWLRESNGEIEAEVYGYPTLYGVGETERHALRSLLELMQLITEELLSDDDPLSYDANAYRLRRYLIETFGGKGDQ